MDYRIYTFTRKNGREENQDYLFYEKKNFAENDTIAVFGVCDGMGGMENGSEISRLTAWTFNAYFSRFVANAMIKEKKEVLNPSSLKQILSDTVQSVQKVIFSYMRKYKIRGGSTLTVGAISDKMLYLINAGDSPCYLINKMNGSVELISNIENCAYEGLKRGTYIDKKSREFSLASSYLTNFIGCEKFRKPEIRSIPVFKDDLILMGSDGLFGSLDPEELLEEATRISVVKLLEKLADRVKKEGEKDNQSGIICRVM